MIIPHLRYNHKLGSLKMNLLQLKLQRNGERREREKIIAKISRPVKEIIEDGQFIYSDELLNKITNSPYSQFESGVITTKQKFRKYIYNEVDDISHLSNLINLSNYEFSNISYLYCGVGPAFIIDGKKRIHCWRNLFIYSMIILLVRYI